MREREDHSTTNITMLNINHIFGKIQLFTAL